MAEYITKIRTAQGDLPVDYKSLANRPTASSVSTVTAGDASSALGYGTTANEYQLACGRYNTNTDAPTSLTDTSGSVFVVGVGTAASSLSNGFRVSTAGIAYACGTFKTSGADYAEYFEWADGNPFNEDRRGYFVTLDGEKIRKATADDDYILGIVSVNPSIAGDTQSEEWQGRYLTDVFGEKLIEEKAIVNEKGETVIVKEWVVNPEYNPDMEYVSREDRQEWDAVGMLGKLVVVDDGSCVVNGYCKVDNEGRATASDNGIRVLSRLDANHIKVMML